MPLKLPHMPPKAALGNLLIDHPFINSIIRVLLFDRLFRTLIVGGVVLVIACGFLVAKLHTTTPPGVLPRIKVSGLDLLQAWSLKRTAREQATHGQLEAALETWSRALANNPADTSLVREFLEHLGQAAPTRDHASTAVRFSRWLLRLTATNHVDLELCVRLNRHFGLEDLTIDLLSPLGDQLTPKLEAALLMALFERNQFARFADRWEIASQLRQGSHAFCTPELALYAAAYNAGWGPLSNAGAGQAELDKAKDDPAMRILAHRLQLRVSERLVQPEQYRQSLDVLEDWRKDRLADHTAYWRLLSSLGRKSDALNLIGAHHVSAESGTDVVLLARAYFDLGKPDVSREILNHYVPEFSDPETVWMTYANLLIDLERWEDLLDVTELMRHEDNPLRDSLAALSFYAEGLGELGKGRRLDAEIAFKRIASAPVKNVLWELVFAEKVDALGFQGAAREILLNLRRALPDDGCFWTLLARTAFEFRKPDLLVSAMTSAYWLHPEDPQVVNDYAAALLATRQRPDEALRLTSQLLEANHADPETQINHALALLQNDRPEDAAAVLQRLSPAQLTDGNLAEYYFATLQLHLAEGRYSDALQAMERVEVKVLLPVEIQQLKLARARLNEMGVAVSARSMN